MTSRFFFFHVVPVSFAIGLMPQSSNAIDIRITPVVVRAFDVAGVNRSVPTSLMELTSERHVFEIQLNLNTSNFGAVEQGFGNVAFDMEFFGNVRRASAPFPSTYTAVNSIIDHDHSSFTDDISLFADNGDLGVPGDLKSVVVGLDPLSVVANDTRLQVGKGAPQVLGKVFVEFDGTSIGSTGVFTVRPTGASVLVGDRLALATDATLFVEALSFTAVPEPGAIFLALLLAPLMGGIRMAR